MDIDLPENFNPKQIDPALLTYQEWLRMVDPKCQTHPSSAYNQDVKQMSTNVATEKKYTKDQWPRLIRTIKRNGLVFEVRLGLESLSGRYTKRDPNGDFIRGPNNDLIYYTDEECKKLGLSLIEWSLAVFHDDLRIGSVQDEWGCMLVMVASEYRSFGLGALLLKIAYGIQPDKPSGGFTSAGIQTFARVHAEFVHDALRSGLYTRQVKEGKLTTARVKEIIASAKAAQSKNSNEMNLQSDDPSDWMMYVGGHGDFIIYDRKLRDILDQGERYDYFMDRMIKGMIYIMHNDRHAHVQTFGADNPKLKHFLMSCGIEYCIRDNVPLYLEADEVPNVDPKMGRIEEDPSNRIGFMSQQIVPTGQRVDYDGIGLAERRWRKTFDRYDEFLHRFMEMAYSKFRQ